MRIVGGFVSGALLTLPKTMYPNEVGKRLGVPLTKFLLGSKISQNIAALRRMSIS